MTEFWAILIIIWVLPVVLSCTTCHVCLQPCCASNWFKKNKNRDNTSLWVSIFVPNFFLISCLGCLIHAYKVYVAQELRLILLPMDYLNLWLGISRNWPRQLLYPTLGARSVRVSSLWDGLRCSVVMTLSAMSCRKSIFNCRFQPQGMSVSNHSMEKF